MRRSSWYTVKTLFACILKYLSQYSCMLFDPCKRQQPKHCLNRQSSAKKRVSSVLDAEDWSERMHPLTLKAHGGETEMERVPHVSQGSRWRARPTVANPRKLRLGVSSVER